LSAVCVSENAQSNLEDEVHSWLEAGFLKPHVSASLPPAVRVIELTAPTKPSAYKLRNTIKHLILVNTTDVLEEDALKNVLKLILTACKERQIAQVLIPISIFPFYSLREELLAIKEWSDANKTTQLNVLLMAPSVGAYNSFVRNANAMFRVNIHDESDESG
jgi:hypothetical protein